MSKGSYKLKFPQGVFSRIGANRFELNSIEINNGSIVHVKIPPFIRALQDYINSFHANENTNDCEVIFNEKSLTISELKFKTKYILHTRLPSSMKNKTLQEVSDYFFYIRNNKSADDCFKIFKNLSLERWLGYRWIDVPIRVQILTMLTFISDHNQFITIILPDLRIPDNEIQSLSEGLKNITIQKELSVLIFSNSQELGNKYDEYRFNGFRVKKDTELGFNDDLEDNEDVA